MTPSDLAKMLEGWPEAARPAFLARYSEPWINGFVPRDLDYGSTNVPTMETVDAVELACMAGLRYLVAGLHVEMQFRPDGWFSIWMPAPDGKRHCGRTMLEAIDAAVRGCK